MLEALLPNGTDVYVALYLGSPIAGGSELTLTGYTRIAWQDWATDTNGTVDRFNNSDILWPAINQAGSADHWAIFDSPSGGILLRAGLTLDGADLPFTIPIGVGDQPRILNSKLRVVVADTPFDQVP